MYMYFTKSDLHKSSPAKIQKIKLIKENSLLNILQNYNYVKYIYKSIT